MASINDVFLGSVQGAKYSTRALSSSTALPGELTGAGDVVMNNSGANPGTYTTRTAAQMIADGNLQPGQSWKLTLCNGQGTGVLTLAAGDGNVTITGTATVAINTARVFVCQVTSLTTITITNIGSYTAP